MAAAALPVAKALGARQFAVPLKAAPAASAATAKAVAQRRPAVRQAAVLVFLWAAVRVRPGLGGEQSTDARDPPSNWSA